LNLGALEFTLGDLEAALAAYQKESALLSRKPVPYVDPQSVSELQLESALNRAVLLGDYRDAVSVGRSGTELKSSSQAQFKRDLITSLAWQHDLAARSELEESIGKKWPKDTSESEKAVWARTGYFVDVALNNWESVRESESTIEAGYEALQSDRDLNVIFNTELRPYRALADAMLGRTGDAETAINSTIKAVPECYNCLRLAGTIYAIAGTWDKSEHYFDLAVKKGPSIPFAYRDWGQALLDRGKPDAAIEKLSLANQRGPHFADALELWGEALMAKNRSDLALAKFSEAQKYAPNWRRLHLKWGEALRYSGQRDAAKMQFDQASQLDLNAAKKKKL
jgi:tetratricopeptide (TPR) repeat protein